MAPSKAFSQLNENGIATVAIAASVATDTVIKAAKGILCRVLVTTTGTASMKIYDNATEGSGTIIGILPANPTVGTTYTFMMPAADGITVDGNGNNPGVTISFS